MKNKRYISGFDWLRLFGAWAVVAIHLPIQPVPIMRLLNVAVPIFALLAGYLTVAGFSGGPLGQTVRQRFDRLFLPYLIWSAFYWVLNNMFFDILVKGEPFSLPSVKGMLKLIFLGSAGPHLWFVPCLFYGQILLLICLTLAGHKRVARYFIFGSCLILSLICINLITDQTSATLLGYCRIYLLRLWVFLFLGGIFALLSPVIYRHKSLAYLLRWGAPVFLAVYVSLVCFDVFKAGLVWGPLVVVTLLFWWVLANNALVVARNCCSTNLQVSMTFSWVKKAAQCTMGVYLLHVVFTAAVAVLGQKFNHVPFKPVVGFGLSSMVFVICLIIVWWLRKAPLVRRVLG